MCKFRWVTITPTPTHTYMYIYEHNENFSNVQDDWINEIQDKLILHTKTYVKRQVPELQVIHNDIDSSS